MTEDGATPGVGAAMADESDFIRRWSRRKRAARQGEKITDDSMIEDPEAIPEGDDLSVATDPKQDGDSSKSGSEDDPEILDLPDIDSLSSDSDFKPFLKKGVPKELRNRAMRKLWQVDPTFRHLDGLNDYDGDFTDAATVVKGLKTLYKVGRGFMPEPKPESAGDEPQADDSPEIATTETAVDPANDPGESDPESEVDARQDGKKITS